MNKVARRANRMTPTSRVNVFAAAAGEDPKLRIAVRIQASRVRRMILRRASRPKGVSSVPGPPRMTRMHPSRVRVGAAGAAEGVRGSGTRRMRDRPTMSRPRSNLMQTMPNRRLMMITRTTSKSNRFVAPVVHDRVHAVETTSRIARMVRHANDRDHATIRMMTRTGLGLDVVDAAVMMSLARKPSADAAAFRPGSKQSSCWSTPTSKTIRSPRGTGGDAAGGVAESAGWFPAAVA